VGDSGFDAGSGSRPVLLRLTRTAPRCPLLEKSLRSFFCARCGSLMPLQNRPATTPCAAPTSDLFANPCPVQLFGCGFHSEGV